MLQEGVGAMLCEEGSQGRPLRRRHLIRKSRPGGWLGADEVGSQMCFRAGSSRICLVSLGVRERRGAQDQKAERARDGVLRGATGKRGAGCLTDLTSTVTHLWSYFLCLFTSSFAQPHLHLPFQGRVSHRASLFPAHPQKIVWLGIEF